MNVINFYGRIISKTSSVKQIRECINILNDIGNKVNTIIVGDTNFEFNNPVFIDFCIDEIKNTEKTNIKEDMKVEFETKFIQLQELCMHQESKKAQVLFKEEAKM